MFLQVKSRQGGLNNETRGKRIFRTGLAADSDTAANGRARAASKDDLILRAAGAKTWSITRITISAYLINESIGGGIPSRSRRPPR